MIKSCCIVNLFSILWKIWLINFFCIFFISFFFIIFIKTLHSLWSNDSLSLSCCFFIVAASSLATSAYNDVSDVKRVFSCICNCLLRSWRMSSTFVHFLRWMHLDFLSFFSETFWRRWTSFRITSFYEWSLFFSFFNIDVYVSRSMISLTFILSLRECLNFTLLFVINCKSSLWL